MLEIGDSVLLTTQLLHEMPLHSTTGKRFYRHNHLDIKGSVWHFILHCFMPQDPLELKEIGQKKCLFAEHAYRQQISNISI